MRVWRSEFLVGHSQGDVGERVQRVQLCSSLRTYCLYFTLTALISSLVTGARGTVRGVWKLLHNNVVSGEVFSSRWGPTFFSPALRCVVVAVVVYDNPWPS